MMECVHCREVFPSKNKLFKHLAVHGVTSKATATLKVSVLIGWIAPKCVDSDAYVKDGTLHARWMEEMDPAEEAFWKAVDHIEPASAISELGQRRKAFTRASSCEARASYLFSLEQSCHSVCDVFCFSLTRNPELPTVAELLSTINDHLPSSVRALYMQELPKAFSAKFHAELSCSQRVFEYLLPRHFLFPSVTPEQEAKASSEAGGAELDASYAHSKDNGLLIRTWAELHQYTSLKKIFKRFMYLSESRSGARRNVHNFVSGGALPDESVTSRKVDRITIRDVVFQQDPTAPGGEGREGGEGGEGGEKDKECEWLSVSISADSLLMGQARKVVGLVVAVVQGYLPLTYLEAAMSNEIVDVPSAPGLSLYLSECRYAKLEAGSASNDIRLDPRRVAVANRIAGGDVQQAVEAINAWRDTVQREIVARYRQLYPLPIQLDKESINCCCDWLTTLKEECDKLIVKRAELLRISEGIRETSVAVYSQPSSVLSTQLESLSLSDSVRAQYTEVLRLLRAADASGLWPANSVGRQKVIVDAKPVDRKSGCVDTPSVSPANGTTSTTSTTATTTPSIDDNSATVIGDVDTYDENAVSPAAVSSSSNSGGSFSVGFLPPPLAVPTGNRLFPELLKACFLLERILCPDRPPSSTIAINRNAQFRPHRDNGAGNGQTGSLIVGLGDYIGGHCVVEGVAHDIRYKPLEFDGWNARHWTLPFYGERYSLVWFTPVGVRVPEDLWWLDSLET